MEPHLNKNDKVVFYQYLDNCNVYFEFGSGGSTYQAAMRPNITSITSVESDKAWHEKLKSILKNDPKIDFIYNEMDTRENNWGHPGPNASHEQRANYSNHILNHKDPGSIDLVFIDGRFRVACCLKCFGVINDDCTIAFDDFFNRPDYHVVLDYFNIVEKTAGNIMVFLKKKTNIDKVPEDIIAHYETIQG